MCSENWSDYFAVIVGSDQVWNYRYTLADSAFMLSFLPDDKYRFSFASSFANKTISDSIIREKYKKYLSNFSAFSVREKNGVSIISDGLGLSDDVTVVLDPTLSEERVASARLNVGVTKEGRICAMQKGGAQPLTKDDIFTAVNIAISKTKELIMGYLQQYGLKI